MAINDLPTPLESSTQCLRSYREAAAHLLKTEPMDRPPLEPRGASKPRPSPCGSPPRFRSTSSSRCRSRTPSPPHAPREEDKAKAPRSVSPGGTAASSAGAALRASLRRDEDGAPQPRRVSWASTLVESVRTRPRTPRQDVAALFYSRADERRFRREAEEAEDDFCEPDEDSLASLSSDEESVDEEEGHTPLWNRGKKDYAISKAVVVFGDSTRTYGGGCALEAAMQAEASGTFTFDDAAFWNGQLTWS